MLQHSASLFYTVHKIGVGFQQQNNSIAHQKVTHFIYIFRS